MSQASIWVFYVSDFIQYSLSLSEEDTVVMVLNLYIRKLRYQAVVETAWTHMAGERQNQVMEAGSLAP